MAQLPTVRRILAESFPEVKWISTLLSPINQFFEGVYTALKNELTIGDNMSAMVRAVTLDGTFPQQFMWTRPRPPTIAWIGACRQTTGTTFTYSDALWLDWEYDGEGNLIINGVPGLDFTSGRKYEIRVVAVSG